MSDIIEFVATNFDTLPEEVLVSLLEKFSNKELVSICSLNKKLKEVCEYYGLIEKRALKILREEAPLAKTSYNITEHVDLINRKFATIYTAYMLPGRPDQTMPYVRNVEFGVVYNREAMALLGNPESDIYGYPLQFSIVGLPPAKNTKVFLLGYVEPSDYDTIWVFENKTDVKDWILNNNEGTTGAFGFQVSLEAAASDGELNYEDVVESFINGDFVYHTIFLQEISLP